MTHKAMFLLILSSIVILNLGAERAAGQPQNVVPGTVLVKFELGKFYL